MNLPAKFKTQRLTLRPPMLNDAADIFSAYASDEKALTYMTWKVCTKVKQVEKFLEYTQTACETENEKYWVITLTDTRQVMGMLRANQNGHKMSIGYILGREFWNKGYMTESLNTLIQITLSIPDITRVWATCDTANIASKRVMEKCGFRQEGILKKWVVHPNVSKKPRDSYIYAYTR